MARSARRDKTSIGSILLNLPTVSEDELDRAVEYQQEHQDILLGETMVLLGFITRRQLDEAITLQRKMRGETVELLEYATQRTRSVAAGIGALASVGADLAMKLKGS